VVATAKTVDVVEHLLAQFRQLSSEERDRFIAAVNEAAVKSPPALPTTPSPAFVRAMERSKALAGRGAILMKG
jgi:hypothetical protein